MTSAPHAPHDAQAALLKRFQKIQSSQQKRALSVASDEQTQHEAAEYKVEYGVYQQQLQDLELARKHEGLRRMNEENQTRSDDRSARRVFARRIFGLVVGWLLGVTAIVVLCGFGVMTLGDSVLIALISGTTLQVLGLFGIVARYLYAHSK